MNARLEPLGNREFAIYQANTVIGYIRWTCRKSTLVDGYYYSKCSNGRMVESYVVYPTPQHCLAGFLKEE